MHAPVLAMLAGLIAGASVAVQNALASMVGGRLGILESVLIVHLGGALLAALLLVPAAGGNLAAWRTVPWFALGAGFLGVLLLGCIIFAVPRLGLASTVALVIAAQLAVGTVLDHYGALELAVRPLPYQRVSGIGVLFLGVWLILK